MVTTITLILTGIQTIVVIVTAAFAWINIRKFKDSRGVNFVLNAESKIDPAYQDLTAAPASVIRSIYTAYDLSKLSDDECRALPFMQSVYLHVSRITFIVANPRLDLGLSRREKEELLQIWFAHLRTFRLHPAMQIVHQSALRDRDVNEAFLRLAVNHLGPAQESDVKPETTVDKVTRVPVDPA